MAMFNCPHCKGIVDETTKICPKCNNDIKKFIKDMVKQNKKNAKSGGVSSIALGSIYNSSSSSDTKLPELDFLKPVQETKLESPSLQEKEQADGNIAKKEEATLDFVQNSLNSPSSSNTTEVTQEPTAEQSAGAKAPSFGTISMSDIIENKPQAGAPLPATPLKSETSESTQNNTSFKSNSLPPISGGNTNSLPPFPGTSTDSAKTNSLPPISGGNTNSLPPFPGTSTDSAKTNSLPPISGGNTNSLPPFPGTSTDSAKTNSLPPISGGNTNSLPPFPGTSTDSAKTNSLPPVSGGSINSLPPISGGNTNSLPPFPETSTDSAKTNSLPPISGGNTNSLPPLSGVSTDSAKTSTLPPLTSLSMTGESSVAEPQKDEIKKTEMVVQQEAPKAESVPQAESIEPEVKEAASAATVGAVKSIFEVDPQPFPMTSTVAPQVGTTEPETQIFGARPVAAAPQAEPVNPETQIFGARPAAVAPQAEPENPETQIFGARPAATAPQGVPAGQVVNPETLMFGNRPVAQQNIPTNPHVGYAMNTSMLSKPAETNEPQRVRKYAMAQNDEAEKEVNTIFESPNLRKKITKDARPASEASSILEKAKEQELKDKAFYANFHVGANGYSAMSYQTQVHEGNVPKNPNSLFDSPTLQKIPEGARPASEAVSILKKSNSTAQGSVFESDALKQQGQNSFAGTAQNYGGAFAQSKSNIPPYKRPPAGAPVQQAMYGAPQSGAGATNPLLNGGQNGTQSMYGAPQSGAGAANPLLNGGQNGGQSMYGAPTGNSLYGAPQQGAPQFMKAGASQNANSTPAGAANPFLSGNNNQ